METLQKPRTPLRTIATGAVLLLVVLSLLQASMHGVDAQGQSPPTNSERLADSARAHVDAPHGLSASLAHLQLTQLEGGNPGDVARQSGLSVRNDDVWATIKFRSASAAKKAKAQIRSLGAQTTSQYSGWVDAWVPVDGLSQLAGLDGVQFVQPVVRTHPADSSASPWMSPRLAGTEVTQGVVQSNADAWHAAGIDGSGVTIAIMDSFKGYTDLQTSGDLPASIDTYGTLDTSSSHGSAVAEIVYDMAPGADLTFASPMTATGMAADIAALAPTHDIISSSLVVFNVEPGDGTGPISDAINAARDDYGTLYVQSDGNYATTHWDGVQSDSNGNGWVDFSPNVDVNQLGWIPSGVDLSYSLRWNDWPTTTQDYDLYLSIWDSTSSTWVDVAWSINDQASSPLPPTEEIDFTTTEAGYYGLSIDRYSASGSEVLDLLGYSSPDFQVDVAARSLADPAPAASALAVGAVDQASGLIMDYSSQGPSHGPGGSLSGGIDQPQLAAYTNVDTVTYGPGGFGGTSSAAPHVAGAAALVMQGYNGATAAQVVTFLRTMAEDDGPAGYDYQYGSGDLKLGAPPPAGASAEPALDLTGYYLPTVFDIGGSGRVFWTRSGLTQDGLAGGTFHFVLWQQIPTDWGVGWARQVTASFGDSLLRTDSAAEAWIATEGNCPPAGGPPESGFKWKAWSGPAEILPTIADRIDNLVVIRGGVRVGSGATPGQYDYVRHVVGLYWDSNGDGTADTYSCGGGAANSIATAR